MTSKLFILFIILLPVLGFSQVSPSIDLIAGLDYSYRTLNSELLDGNRTRETGKLNWRGGLNYNQPITSQFFLKTGLRLASVGYKGENNTDVRWPSENNGGTWVPDPALPRELQLIYDYWFLEIPIAARWEMNNKKVIPFFELGIAPSIYMTTKTISKTELGRTTQLERNSFPTFNKVHFVGLAAFGINYVISDYLQVFGQPTARYHITGTSRSSVNENLFNIGLELGLRKKLGKKSVEK